MQLAGYDEFTNTHPEFLLYAEHAEWLLTSLSADAASIQLLQTDGNMMLYLVTVKKDSTNHGPVVPSKTAQNGAS